MPRRLVLVPIACLLVAGCGASGAAEPARLAAWSFPARPLVPWVQQAPAEPAAVTAPVRRPVRRAAAAPPSAGADVAPGAPSDAEVRAQLRELYGGGPAETRGGGDRSVLTRTVTLDGGQAVAPPDAPAAVQRIVAAANQVARLPYVYGGGHGGAEGLFVDSAYDCSGSVSFALANAGLIRRPMTSGELARWGRPGRGRWVTIYANAGHAFMVVGGARFDTVGLRQTGSRWQPPYRSISGFTAVHPPGL